MENQNTLEEVIVERCRTGDAAALQSILLQSPQIDLNFITDGGVTLLMHALVGLGEGSSTTQGCFEICQMLIQAGAVGNLTSADTAYGRTAAHWAVHYRQHQILDLLIQAGCDLTALDRTGISPFHLAIVEKATLCLQVAISLEPREILECSDAEGRSPLMLAVQANDADVCQLLIQAGCNTNASHHITGQTPLHLAVEMNNTVVQELLLKGGAVLSFDASGVTPVHLAALLDSEETLDIFAELVGLEGLDLADAKGLTPLMHACAHGNEKTVKYLIKKKVDVRARDAEGKSCLHWAAGSIYPMAPKCLNLVIKKAQDLLYVADIAGKTALHSCASGGTVDTLRALLECGLPDVMATDEEQRTAVHWAAACGNSDVLAVLAECGCPVSTPDIYSAYPVHYAVQGTSLPIGEQSEETLSFSLNCLKCLEALLDKEAPADSRDSSGLQPLHWAAQYPNNQQALFLLVDHGADPAAQDNEGLTGLHISAGQGHVENCQYLIDRTGGTIASVLDSRGRTALHSATENGQLESMKYLLSLGFSADYQDNDGRSPVHVAAGAGMTAALEVLASCGADLSQKTAYGTSALHEAAANGHADALRYLITCGLAVDEPIGSNGTTPLHYAVSGKHIDCVGVLISCGANVNCVMSSEEGNLFTPVDLCEENSEILELLVQQGGVSGAVSTAAETQGQKPTGGDVPNMEPGLGMEPGLEDDASAITKKAQMMAAEIVGAVITSPKEAEPIRGDGSQMEQERMPQPSSVPSHTTDHHHTADHHGDDSVSEVQQVSNPQEGVPLSQRPKMNSVQPEPSSSSSRPQTSQTESLRAKSQLDKKRGILERAFSVLKRTRSPPPGSILSSTVGFYSAHATMLAAAIIGTPLGDKATEVAVKVVTDTAEELKRLAAAAEKELPDLVWLQEKTPTPPPPVVKVPTPEPPAPPTPDIEVDPQERRLRKALAQMDMTKSPGYLAAEELLRAQATHNKLSRQFQEARLKEQLAEMRADFSSQEAIERLARDLEKQKMDNKIKAVTATSEQITDTIDNHLALARVENSKVSNIMADMKIHPRPTVAQWLQQKQEQRKIALQTALMSWDIDKKKRDTSILVQQVVTSQRALQHAAWGARKELMAKLRTLKEGDVIEGPNRQTIADLKADLHKKYHRLLQQQQSFPKPPNAHKKTFQRRVEAIKPPRPSHTKRTTSISTIRFTPNNVLQFRERSTSEASDGKSDCKQHMWQLGEGFGSGKVGLKMGHPKSQAASRAIGPKTVHAGRTLVFLPPDQYKGSRTRRLPPPQQPPRVPSLQPQRSNVHIQALNFDVMEPRRIRGGLATSSRVQYHTLAGSVSRHGGQQQTRQNMSAGSVLPMEVINSPRTNQLTAAIAS